MHDGPNAVVSDAIFHPDGNLSVLYGDEDQYHGVVEKAVLSLLFLKQTLQSYASIRTASTEPDAQAASSASMIMADNLMSISSQFIQDRFRFLNTDNGKLYPPPPSCNIDTEETDSLRILKSLTWSDNIEHLHMLYVILMSFDPPEGLHSFRDPEDRVIVKYKMMDSNTILACCMGIAPNNCSKRVPVVILYFNQQTQCWLYHDMQLLESKNSTLDSWHETFHEAQMHFNSTHLTTNDIVNDPGYEQYWKRYDSEQKFSIDDELPNIVRNKEGKVENDLGTSENNDEEDSYWDDYEDHLPSF